MKGGPSNTLSVAFAGTSLIRSFPKTLLGVKGDTVNN